MFNRRNNTSEKGRVRFIIFKEGNDWYGVALEFNLVVEGEDAPTAFFNLNSAIQGYVEATKAAHLRNTVLNQDIDHEYAKLWKLLEEGKNPELESPIQGNERQERQPVLVHNYGFFSQTA